MSDVALLLGPVVFRDFELPSNINFGGRHRLALHRLPGGGRIIDTLGRDDAQISFSGIFTGPDATLRARNLDGLRAAGNVLPLTWDIFFYSVLISEYRADYRNGSWIPYRIVCTVLQDEALSAMQTAVSIATSVMGDVRSATECATAAGLNLALSAEAFPVSGRNVPGTVSYIGARSDLADARLAIGAAINNANTELSDIDLSHTGTAQEGVAELLAATDVAGRLSMLTSADAYVRHAELNIANAST